MIKAVAFMVGICCLIYIGSFVADIHTSRVEAEKAQRAEAQAIIDKYVRRAAEGR